MDDERLPERPLYGDVATGSRRQGSQVLSLQGYSENLPKAPADQPGKLGKPHARLTYTEGNSEDRSSNLRSRPHHRRESQTRETAAAASQHQRPTNSNVSTMLTDIPGANWTCWTPPDQLQHQACTKRRLSVHLSLASQAVNKRRPPLTTTPILLLLLLLLLLHRLIVRRCGACHAHQHYTQS
ncbi:hypothetical protein SprV_0602145300 [Sparganum proliferum]